MTDFPTPRHSSSAPSSTGNGSAAADSSANATPATATASSTAAAGPTPVTAEVTISRTHPADIGQRQVLARVDEGETHTLMFGESVTLQVPAGTHLLRANNTLIWKRQTFTVGPGERTEFVLINKPGRFTLSFLSLLGVAPLFLTIERRQPA